MVKCENVRSYPMHLIIFGWFKPDNISTSLRNGLTILLFTLLVRFADGLGVRTSSTLQIFAAKTLLIILLYSRLLYYVF